MENQNSQESQSLKEEKEKAEALKKQQAADAKKESDAQAKKDKEAADAKEKEEKEKAEALKNSPERKAYVEAVNKYVEVFGSVPNDALSTESLNTLIRNKIAEVIQGNNTNVSKPVKSNETFDVKHNDEKYNFPIGEKNNFIVRHSKMFTSPSGQEMEDPGSVRIQIYRPEVYADLINENEATGEKNAFVQSGDKTIVLNDPTKETN